MADDSELWRDLGFEVNGERCRLRSIDVVLTGADSGRGIHGWAWTGSDGPTIDGIPCTRVDGRGVGVTEPHPNHSVGLFYVVLFGPSWDAAATALSDVGVDPGEPRPMGSKDQPRLRSVADAGDVEIEVIGPPDHDPSSAWRLWGSIVEVDDIDATAAYLGSRLLSVKPAIQRGRRIATLDRSAGSSVPLAFMSPVES